LARQIRCFFLNLEKQNGAKRGSHFSSVAYFKNCQNSTLFTSMKTVITFFLLALLTTATVYGQCELCETCGLCEGSGSVWSREQGFKYNDVVLQRDGTYTYNSKDYVSRRTQRTCPVCGGSGYILPKPKPKPTYYTGKPVRTYKQGPRDVDEVLKKDFYLATNRMEVNGTVYQILQEKADHSRYSLVKVTGELTYQTLASNATNITLREDENDQFIAFKVSAADGSTQYLREDGSRLYATSSESHLASPEGYLWVHVGKKAPAYTYRHDLILKTGEPIPYFALYDGRSGRQLLAEAYSAPHNCRCMDMWKQDGMLDVSVFKLENETYKGYSSSVGIVNRNNEFIIPAEFNRVDSCLNNGIITMVDKNFLVRTFNQDGQEIEPPLEDVKTCPDGNQIIRSKYVVSKYNTKTKRLERTDKWIYQLINPDKQPVIPLVMESCGCYDEEGWAEIVPVNSADRFLSHRDKRLILNCSEDQPLNFQTKGMTAGIKATREQVQFGLESGIMHRSYQDRGPDWRAQFDRFQYFSRFPKVPAIVDLGDATCETSLDLPAWIRGRREATVYAQKTKNGDCACAYYPESKQQFDKCSPSGIVEVKGKLGFVLDKYTTNSPVVPAKYQAIYPVRLDEALMVQDFRGKWGLISVGGTKRYKMVVKCSYDAIYSIANDTYLGLIGGSYDLIRDLDHPSRKLTIKRLSELSPYRKQIVDLNDRFPDFKGIDPEVFSELFDAESIAQIAEIAFTYGSPKVRMQDGRRFFLFEKQAIELEEGLVDAAYPYEDSDYLTSLPVQHKNGKWGLLKFNHKAKKEEVTYQLVVDAETGYDQVQLFYYHSYYDPLPVFTDKHGSVILRNYRPFSALVPNNTTIPYLIERKTK
jgi:hypothetical protein